MGISLRERRETVRLNSARWDKQRDMKLVESASPARNDETGESCFEYRALVWAILNQQNEKAP